MVIQRWQSLLLLIAGISMAIFTFSSLGQWQTEDYTFNFTTLGITYEGEATDGALTGMARSTWFLFVVSLTSTILCFIDIFLFRNLKRQKTVCMATILLMCAVAVMTTFIGYTAVEGYDIGWSSAVIALLVAFIAAMAAWRGINKDRKLLGSADRLR